MAQLSKGWLLRLVDNDSVLHHTTSGLCLELRQSILTESQIPPNSKVGTYLRLGDDISVSTSARITGFGCE